MTERKIPRHVAIIMDGNGRWAERRRLPRTQGHLEGVKRVAEVVDVAAEVGIEAVTFFTFSQENWKRPETEVSMLMQTICRALDMKSAEIAKRNMRLRFIGRREGIPADVLKGFDRTAAVTRANTGLIINLAFNYSARTEIVDAARTLARRVADGGLAPEEITESVFQQCLYAPDIPDPDLLIRTSGEQRLSNFLLWQVSYAEFYFTPVCWPEFTAEEFRKALAEYERRERRFGGVTGRQSGEGVADES